MVSPAATTVDGHINAPVRTLDPLLRAVVDSEESLPTSPYYASRLSPESRAYIIYTSGSTGVPKGVQLQHKSITYLVASEKILYGRAQKILSTDRVLQGFSLSFDASLEELWIAWSNGASLVTASAGLMRMGPDLPEELLNLRISVLSTVPTLLLSMSQSTEVVARFARSLKILILGGEALSQELVDYWAAKVGAMYNTYGPTEATVICTAARCRPSVQVTIGRATPGYAIHVLPLQPDDAQQQESSSAGGDLLIKMIETTGEPGQLAVSGIPVALGYLNRPEANEKAFRLVNGVRMYLTGDKVAWTDVQYSKKFFFSCI